MRLQKAKIWGRVKMRKHAYEHVSPESSKYPKTAETIFFSFS